MIFCYLAEELSSDEISAKDKEEVYARPPETANFIQVGRMSEDAIMVNEDEDDSQCPQVVQACQAATG